MGLDNKIQTSIISIYPQAKQHLDMQASGMTVKQVLKGAAIATVALAAIALIGGAIAAYTQGLHIGSLNLSLGKAIGVPLMQGAGITLLIAGGIYFYCIKNQETKDQEVKALKTTQESRNQINDLNQKLEQNKSETVNDEALGDAAQVEKIHINQTNPPQTKAGGAAQGRSDLQCVSKVVENEDEYLSFTTQDILDHIKITRQMSQQLKQDMYFLEVDYQSAKLELSDAEARYLLAQLESEKNPNNKALAETFANCQLEVNTLEKNLQGIEQAISNAKLEKDNLDQQKVALNIQLGIHGVLDRLSQS